MFRAISIGLFAALCLSVTPVLAEASAETVAAYEASCIGFLTAGAEDNGRNVDAEAIAGNCACVGKKVAVDLSDDEALMLSRILAGTTTTEDEASPWRESLPNYQDGALMACSLAQPN